MTHDDVFATGFGYGCARWPTSWAESGRPAGSCGAPLDVLPLAQACATLGARRPAPARAATAAVAACRPSGLPDHPCPTRFAESWGWRTSHQRGSSDRASPACKPHASASAWLARAAAIAPCAARWDPASITPARRRTNAADHGLRLLTAQAGGRPLAAQRGPRPPHAPRQPDPTYPHRSVDPHPQPHAARRSTRAARCREAGVEQLAQRDVERMIGGANALARPQLPGSLRAPRRRQRPSDQESSLSRVFQPSPATANARHSCNPLRRVPPRSDQRDGKRVRMLAGRR